MSGSTALLVVLGVVGYLLLRHCCHRTSFRWDALEWQQNLFESTAVGLGLFGACRLVSPLGRYAANAVGLPAERVAAFAGDKFPVPFAASVIAALLLGLGGSLVANRRWPRDMAQALAVRHHGGSLRVLFLDAHLSQRTVMVTLNSRKVYVGWVFSPPSLRRPAHVVLFPTLSGARSSEDLSITWTTDYSPVYIDLMSRFKRAERPSTEPVHFQLVIPLDSIQSATYFDKDLYDRHFAPKPVAGTG